MILNRTQADSVLELAATFWNYTMLTLRVSISGGITVNMTAIPSNIRITKTGQPEENYTLIEDMRIAYIAVV